MKIAIITGASSGMGREYARQAAASGRYDQIWALARRRERLEALSDELPCDVHPLALDLSRTEAIDQVAELLRQAREHDPGLTVGLLINAAGFGKFGTCDDMSEAEVSSMIDVNCRALVCMTQACLPYMSRGSRIIQFASSAGFQPLPGLNVYAASKSFVISYTRALRWELRGRHIHVTAVCPIWIKTEFVEVARQTANGQSVRHPWPQLSASHVARWSLLINRLNYPIATCSLIAFLMRIWNKVVPYPLTMWIWEGLRRI